MAKIPHQDRLRRCPFYKHKGELWVEILEEDRQYVEWLVSFEGPTLDEELYDTLIELLEES